MVYFVGILDGSGDVWGVRVPMLPGCYGGGASPEEAIWDVTAAAREWLHQAPVNPTAAGSIPSLSDHLKNTSHDLGKGESLVILHVVLDQGRTVRVNLTLDAGLLEAVDRAAKDRGLTRSAFFASAAREKIEQGT